MLVKTIALPSAAATKDPDVVLMGRAPDASPATNPLLVVLQL